jgi:hypothetical protein
MSQSKEELPESQEVSSESPEDEEPKANPFIPNPKAQWCPKCEAHWSDYDYSYYHSVSGGNSTIEDQYSCKVCKATMFNPAETLPWMYGTVGFGAFLLAIGLLIGLFKGEFDFKNGGPEAVLILFAIFPPLIGLMQYTYMRKWFAWSSAQKKKSAEELEQEAMNAPSAAEGGSAEKTEP